LSWFVYKWTTVQIVYTSRTMYMWTSRHVHIRIYCACMCSIYEKLILIPLCVLASNEPIFPAEYLLKLIETHCCLQPFFVEDRLYCVFLFLYESLISVRHCVIKNCSALPCLTFNFKMFCVVIALFSINYNWLKI